MGLRAMRPHSMCVCGPIVLQLPVKSNLRHETIVSTCPNGSLSLGLALADISRHYSES